MTRMLECTDVGGDLISSCVVGVVEVDIVSTQGGWRRSVYTKSALNGSPHREKQLKMAIICGVGSLCRFVGRDPKVEVKRRREIPATSYLV
jgi:hypothetical protein